MTNPQALIQRAQSQTQANRFAFLIRATNAKLVEKIRRT
jgi:lipopolysaccharide export system protein LptC